MYRSLVVLACMLLGCPPQKPAPVAKIVEDAPAPAQVSKPPEPVPPLKLVAWTGEKSKRWGEVDKLESEQKYEAAAKVVGEILEEARRSGNSEDFVRAMIRTVQVRTTLHGYETAVRFMADEAWVEDLLGKTALHLYFAHSLTTYTNAYGWEIRKREKVVSGKEVDLKKWTWAQIHQKASEQFLAAWQQREGLGQQKLGVLQEYVNANNYPREIRGTLRDAVTYLWVAQLANTATWRPEQQNGIHALDFDALIADVVPVPAVQDPAVHPLRKIAGLLSELEQWHRAEGRVEAAFEARHERLSRLHGRFTDKGDRTKIRESLAAEAEKIRDQKWWALGRSTLARLVRETNEPDAEIEALEIAQECADAYPESVGGARCRSIAASIQQPSFNLDGAMVDGAGKRSVGVTHRNLETLYFRAWRYDAHRYAAKQKDYSLVPDRRYVEPIVDGQSPNAEWTVKLPATTDYRNHRTWVVPPMKEKGAYIVVATTDPEYRRTSSPMQVVLVTVSDMVLIERSGPGVIEGRVLNGPNGEPASGAKVMAYEMNWRSGHDRIGTKKVDAEGRFTFRGGSGKQVFLVATRGDDVVLDSQGLSFGWKGSRGSQRQAFVYTDRSVYRPGQTVHWQIVAWRGERAAAKFAVDPNAKLEVILRDANRQEVLKEKVTTNEFGSAAGTFVVPSGRALGQWYVQTNIGANGGQVRVEEYKRPTFEAEIDAPKEQLRLNQPAKIIGNARYYFGLPVAAGTVNWRVTRTANYPWWWSYYYGGGSSGSQVMGTGTVSLDEEGKFEIDFTPAADERLAKGRSRAVTYSYQISADVTDEGGETRSAARTIRLGFVSIRANVQLPANFLRPNTAAELTVARTNLDGQPAPGEGEWKLFELKSDGPVPTPAELPLPGDKPHATPGDKQRARWSSGYSSAMALSLLKDGAEVAKGSLKHDEEGKAKLSIEVPAGAYRLRYTSKDKFGAEYETEQFVMVAGKTAPLPVPVEMLVEKSSVKVGETARVLVHSAYADQPLYLDRWRAGERVSRQVVRVGAGPAVLEFPITEADRGGFGLTVEWVRDHQFVRLQKTVGVPWDNKKLDVEFSTFRDKLRPGQKETWTVRVKGPQAAKASAEVLAYMYDKSLDVFAPHSPPTPSSLYPWRASAPWMRSTARVSQRVWLSSGSFPGVPSSPSLVGDRLKFPSRYGVGGPGRRGRRSRRSRAFGSVALDDAEVPMAAPAPAEPEADEERSADKSAVRADAPAKKMKAKLGKSANEQQAEGLRGEDAAAAQAPTQLRTNFSETAFFKPQLKLGPEGSVDISFEVPDSVTGWNVYVHAIGKDLSSGMVKKETQTVKELMVRPYLPRFLRENDQATLEVVINNAGDADLSGALDFDIIDPETEKSVASEFGLKAADLKGVKFAAKVKGSDRKSFQVKAPARVGMVAFKVTARAGKFSDGELRPIPLLPGRVHLAQSRFTTLDGVEKKTLRFDELARDDDPTRINEQLVVTLDGQLFYNVLSALPYLVNYPYECTEQTLNRFVSTGILSSMYADYPSVAKMAKKLSERNTQLETWDDDDPNRKLALEETPWVVEAKGGAAKNFEKVLDPRIAKATRIASLAKLRKSQTAIGGFPWWSGGRPSPYMTLYILHGLSKALEFGVPVPKNMTRKAWQYLRRHYIDEAVRHALAHNCCWEFITTINYVLTNYPDESYGGGVFDAALRKTMLDFSFKHWKEHSPYLKGYLALTLHRTGRKKDAELVWESVLDSAKEKPDQGTFWAPEDRSWLWYNDTIETHAFALRTTMEIKPKWAKLRGMVLWIFINKKLNHWKSTRATSEVIYSLAHYLKSTGELGIREETAVTVGPVEKTFVFEPDEFTGKKNQIVVPGKDVTKAHAEVVIEKKTKGFQMASATWHFSTEKMPKEAHGDFLGVTRTYYKRVKSGREVTLEPLAEGSRVAVGDEVEVQLSLRSKHALEYVHLRDPRAAGFEPVTLRSQHKWDLGIRWFEEVRDSATNFFFEALPHGEYNFKYRLRATTAGTFKVGPATVQPMYAPEFTAYSAGHVLGIEKAE